ncbi:MAG: UPF0149 family protein [Natronospirillum sp.]
MDLDYYAVDDVLADLDPTESVAFLHGSLVARLVSGLRLERAAWLATAQEQLEIDAELTEEHAAVLHQLYDQTLGDLSNDAFRLRLVLPSEDAALADRLEALSDWCAGFVSTLGVTGQLSAPDGEDEELLEDLIAIAQLDVESESDAEAEEDYAALTEHVRLAAHHFQLVLGAPAADQKPTLH